MFYTVTKRLQSVIIFVTNTLIFVTFKNNYIKIDIIK